MVATAVLLLLYVMAPELAVTGAVVVGAVPPNATLVALIANGVVIGAAPAVTVKVVVDELWA
jgi:hypothetical protein